MGPFVWSHNKNLDVLAHPNPERYPGQRILVVRLDDVEAGSLRSVASPQLFAQWRAAAHPTGQKDQRINIRLSSPDLQALRARAQQDGIPCQTLISGELHKDIKLPNPGNGSTSSTERQAVAHRLERDLQRAQTDQVAAAVAQPKAHKASLLIPPGRRCCSARAAPLRDRRPGGCAAGSRVRWGRRRDGLAAVPEGSTVRT
jgi:predicted DNA binding CopG/RHH family protein